MLQHRNSKFFRRPKAKTPAGLGGHFQLLGSGLVYFPENFAKFFTFPVTSNL